jgi:hypothetical protein
MFLNMFCGCWIRWTMTKCITLKDNDFKSTSRWTRWKILFDKDAKHLLQIIQQTTLMHRISTKTQARKGVILSPSGCLQKLGKM